MLDITNKGAACGPSPIHPDAFIHPLAFVDGSTIGARTRIWQFASVVRGAILGDDCSVASGVTIDGCVFGHSCVISQGVTTAPGLFCGNSVFLGPNASFCNDRWPRVDKVGFDICEYDEGHRAIVIEGGASIGARVVVLPGVRIGKNAMIAAGSVVNRRVPAFHLFTRDGRIVEIDIERTKQRMKFA